MVKVIEKCKELRTECDKCFSILEYSPREDVHKGTTYFTTYDFMSGERNYKYIECPVCGRKVEVLR